MVSEPLARLEAEPVARARTARPRRSPRARRTCSPTRRRPSRRSRASREAVRARARAGRALRAAARERRGRPLLRAARMARPARRARPADTGRCPRRRLRERRRERRRPRLRVLRPGALRRPSRAWPLIVALHGGGGNGRDFVWTWLREARSRGYLLLAPSSHGSTWSFLGADVDAPRLASLIAWLGERWHIDARRILLTGLSDGATYTLCGRPRAGRAVPALAPAPAFSTPRTSRTGTSSARAACRCT